MKLIKYWLPTLVWMLIIFLFSSRPAMQAATIDWFDFGIKKTAHYIEYYVLFMLMSYSLIHSLARPRGRVLLLALCLSVIFAASDEYHQSLVPGRGPRVRDVLIDSWGAMVAFATISKFRPSDTTG